MWIFDVITQAAAQVTNPEAVPTGNLRGVEFIWAGGKTADGTLIGGGRAVVSRGTTFPRRWPGSARYGERTVRYDAEDGVFYTA